MAIVFDPTIPLGKPRPWLTAEAANIARLRTILETRPGEVPWRPDFGCDLHDVVGANATPQVVNDVRWRIRSAIKKWMPDVEVLQVHVTVVSAGGSVSGRNVPIGESALMSLGVQAALHVDVEVQGEDGVYAVSATVDP